MCGIAGIIHLSDRRDSPTVESLQSMIAAIRYRGPDEYGLYRDHHAGLVHARLSIIDLQTGQQPMSNEDRTLWVVFNGEIFNFIELKIELEKLGHRFQTHSDTEIILHAFESWGTDCFSRFNGQWALALWNAQTHTLILSRDRIGVRPLYIHESKRRILFGSEIKALFTDPSVPRSINPQGLDQTFTYWASLAPVTMFEGIEELPPASFRVYGPEGEKKEKLYWRPIYSGAPRTWDDDSHFPSFTDTTELLREKLEQATRLRMLRSDVPVGSYLSGGLDSSLIAQLGRRAKEGRFETFSIRFDDPEFDETEYQRMMASTLDSSHREIVVTRKDIAQVFPDVIRHTERPILRTAPAPLFLLSKAVRESGIKAVLTGEGADEMLAGYDIFREAKIRQFWSHQPVSKARPMLFDRIYPYLARSPQRARGMAFEFWKKGLERAGSPGFSHEPRWQTTSSLKKFLSRNILDSLEKNPPSSPLNNLPESFSRWDSLAQAQYLEITTLLSTYLISSQGDRMLMAHSVEGRFPFLDAEVMEFCNNLPAEYKLAFLQEKRILKKVAEGVIPEPIIHRKKQPYRAPDAASFLSRDTPPYVQELFSDDALKRNGIFDPQTVQGFYNKCISRREKIHESGLFSNTDNMAFVGILSTQLLVQQFIETPESKRATDIRFNTLIDSTQQPSPVY
jgi:asparagine synthase (glutamine-hydrolysing)